MDLQLSHRDNLMRAVETGQLDQLEHRNAVLGLDPDTTAMSQQVSAPSRLFRYDPTHPMAGTFWVLVKSGSPTDGWEQIS